MPLLTIESLFLSRQFLFRNSHLWPGFLTPDLSVQGFEHSFLQCPGFPIFKDTFFDYGSDSSMASHEKDYQHGSRETSFHELLIETFSLLGYVLIPRNRSDCLRWRHRGTHRCNVPSRNFRLNSLHKMCIFQPVIDGMKANLYG